MQSQNPFDESFFASYEEHDDATVQAALHNHPLPTSHSGYDPGSLAVRQESLQAVGRLLRDRASELSELMTREMGKPITQSQAEVEKSAGCCDYFAANAAAMLQPEVIATEASHSEIRFEPLGTILAIMPWNFPVWQVVRFAAPALMAGNRVLLKHAPNVCGCAEMIEQIFTSAFGPMALCNLRISHERTAELIQYPLLAGVTLTGSERAGREVGRLAGEAIRPCVMELGGVDPFIVLEDAELDVVVPAAVKARTMNNGQSCIAAKRFIVETAVADEFTDRFVTAMKALKMGDPSNPQTELGPLAREDLRDTLHEQVQTEVQQRGTELLCGGEIPEQSGWFYPPTVLRQMFVDGVDHISETFGPVAKIEVAAADSNWEQALGESHYGLGASIWTQDLERAQAIIPQLKCGSVFINEVTKSDNQVPFGGVKNSGYGRELSGYGLREFTNVKTVWIA